MTKSDILKRLAPMDDDKVIIVIDRNGGWSNIEALTEKQSNIELSIEETPVFSEN